MRKTIRGLLILLAVAVASTGLMCVEAGGVDPQTCQPGHQPTQQDCDTICVYNCGKWGETCHTPGVPEGVCCTYPTCSTGAEEFGGKHPSQWPTDEECDQVCHAANPCVVGICTAGVANGEGGCSWTCAAIEDVVEVTWEPAPEQTLGGTVPLAEAYCGLKCKQYCSPAMCTGYKIWGKIPHLKCGEFQCLL